MRYFKHNDLPISEVMTFEDREYLNLEFYFIILNIIGLEGSVDSIEKWLIRTDALEMSKEEVDAVINEAEQVINTQEQ